MEEDLPRKLVSLRGLQVVAKGNEKVSEGNQAIIDALAEAGALLKHEEYAHKYPYDWRTGKPTIFRATEQWFCLSRRFPRCSIKSNLYRNLDSCPRRKNVSRRW